MYTFVNLLQKRSRRFEFGFGFRFDFQRFPCRPGRPFFDSIFFSTEMHGQGNPRIVTAERMSNKNCTNGMSGLK